MRRTIPNFIRLIAGAEPNNSGEFEPLNDYKGAISIFSVIITIALTIIVWSAISEDNG